VHRIGISAAAGTGKNAETRAFPKGCLRGNPEGKESAGACAQAAGMIKSEQIGKDGCGTPARENLTGAAGFLCIQIIRFEVIGDEQS
jgi:hypothetical protein